MGPSEYTGKKVRAPMMNITLINMMMNMTPVVGKVAMLSGMIFFRARDPATANAGIMAAKRTHELIPMCHPLLVTDIAVDFEILAEGDATTPARVGITGTAKNVGKTGVEMEALVAVTTAALTIYDMAKAVDRAMRIENVRLVLKRGGKSGEVRLE